MAAGVDEFADTLAELVHQSINPQKTAIWNGFIYGRVSVFQNCSELNTSALTNSAVS